MNVGSAIALVTGAASGLGRATAQRLLKNGAKVVVVDLPNALEGEGLENLKASTPEFSENPDNVLFAPCDVTSEDDVKAALDNAEAKFGGNVNVAVNCAGIVIAAKTVSKKARTLCPIFKRFGRERSRLVQYYTINSRENVRFRSGLTTTTIEVS